MARNSCPDRTFPTRNGTSVRYDWDATENGPKPSAGNTRPALTTPNWTRRMAVNQSIETWRDTRVAGYQVSTYGRVRNTRTGRILKPWVGDSGGHLKVELRGHRPFVHQLVVDAFIGERSGLDVCHNDNDPTNNRVSNLRVDTRSANVLDLRKLRTHCPHGHEYTPSNTYIQSDTGWRRCRECKKRYR